MSPLTHSRPFIRFALWSLYFLATHERLPSTRKMWHWILLPMQMLMGFIVSACVALAIVLWEYVTFLPDEIRLYRKPVWTTVPPYAFLALRYGGILATFPVLFLSAIKTNSCQLAASLSQAGVVLVVVSSAMIFAFRTSLFWADNRIIRAALVGLLIFMTACLIALATQYRATPRPAPFLGSNCHVLPTLAWSPLGDASSALVFITALILTLLKMHHHRRDSPYIYNANLAYLLGTTVTAVTVLVIMSLSPPSSALILSTRCIATVFTVAFGTRAFRNFVLASAYEADRVHSHPYPSSSPIISPSSEMRFALPPPTRPLPSVVARNAKSPRAPTVGLRRPNTADSTRPHTANSTRPHTASSTRPHTADSTRPHTAGSTDNESTAPLNPYTTFPSPPNSYINHSLGSPSSTSHSAPFVTPPRVSPVRQIPEPPKSTWSDL
ncbi:hypothetical protein B0H12DRAFT_770515 [Mycena haematopus]|nr:hypothetical protein B0H12DRAFT_770515 [Mycena haematopus]